MDDDLQMAWDMALVRAYFETPHKNMTAVVKDFLRKQGLHDFSEFFALDLKRIPKRSKSHWHCLVTRFVYAYLPNVYKALTAHGPSKIIDLVIAIGKSNADTYINPVDSKESSRLSYMRKREALTLRAADISRGLSKNYLKSRNPSRNWNTVK